MDSRPDVIATLAAALAEDGGFKIWSVVVTVLGDIAQADRAAEISGPALAQLLSRLGIQPDALRVALHRLRQDGWTDTRKSARTNYIRLSARGLAETEAVADRVFGVGPTRRLALSLGIAPLVRPNTPPPDIALGLGRGRWIVDHSKAEALDGWLLCDLPEVWPDWFTSQVEQVARAEDFVRLSGWLDMVDAYAVTPESGDATALRVLILHGWRRLILRANPLAERVLGPGSAVATCRARVRAKLDTLPRAVGPQTKD